MNKKEKIIWLCGVVYDCEHATQKKAQDHINEMDVSREEDYISLVDSPIIKEKETE